MSDSPTNFPREDLGETKEFRITSGRVIIEGEDKPSFYGGRHHYIRAVDKPHLGRQPTFMCLACQTWGIFDKKAHTCGRELGNQQSSEG